VKHPIQEEVMNRTIRMYGVPCEVLEEDVEVGIVLEDGREELSSTFFYTPRMLVVAPDGSFVLPNPFGHEYVDMSQPNPSEMVSALRRMAKDIAK
jgi:hypothetical protein